jgi:hypothetical protein
MLQICKEYPRGELQGSQAILSTITMPEQLTPFVLLPLFVMSYKMEMQEKRKEKRMKRVQTQLVFLNCLALVFVADLLRNVKLTILPPWARIPTTHLLLTATMEDKTMLSAPVVSSA